MKPLSEHFQDWLKEHPSVQLAFAEAEGFTVNAVYRKGREVNEGAIRWKIRTLEMSRDDRDCFSAFIRVGRFDILSSDAAAAVTAGKAAIRDSNHSMPDKIVAGAMVLGHETGSPKFSLSQMTDLFSKLGQGSSGVSTAILQMLEKKKSPLIELVANDDEDSDQKRYQLTEAGSDAVRHLFY